MSRRALLFLIAVCLLGFATLLYGAWTWSIDDLPKFVAYFLISIIASRLKVKMPEITGTVSVNFLFILIGIVELNFSETLVIGCASILAQSYSTEQGWPKSEQVVFNVCSVSFAIWGAYFVFHGPLHLIGLGDVDDDAERQSAGLGDLLVHRAGGFLVTVDDGDRDMSVGQQQRRGPADPTPPAGDERHLARELCQRLPHRSMISLEATRALAR